MTEQVRICLWSAPRSVSTAFFRAMMNKTNCKTLLEPFDYAFYLGSERVSRRFESQPIQDCCTYSDAKTLCEQPYDGYSTAFVKEMALHLSGHLDNIDYLPTGFKHAFLLRHPRKSVSSLYKMATVKKDVTWDSFDENEAGYRELYRVFLLVTEQLGQKPVVIDADDLIENPEAMMRLFCDLMGITFEDGMIHWDENPQHLTVFQQYLPWFEVVVKSNSFLRSTSAAEDDLATRTSNLPPSVLTFIDECLVYYSKMYSQRLRL